MPAYAATATADRERNRCRAPAAPGLRFERGGAEILHDERGGDRDQDRKRVDPHEHHRAQDEAGDGAGNRPAVFAALEVEPDTAEREDLEGQLGVCVAPANQSATARGPTMRDRAVPIGGPALWSPARRGPGARAHRGARGVRASRYRLRPTSRAQGVPAGTREVRLQPVMEHVEPGRFRSERAWVVEGGGRHARAECVRACDRTPGVDVDRRVAISEQVLRVGDAGDREERECDGDGRDRRTVARVASARARGRKGQAAAVITVATTVQVTAWYECFHSRTNAKSRRPPTRREPSTAPR